MSIPNPPGQVILDLKDTYGAMIAGAQLSMGLLAVQYIQTVYYFLNYPNDPWYEQLMIFGAAVLSTAHQAVTAKPLWITLIQHFGSIDHATRLQPDFTYQIIFTGVAAFGVQVFFLRRIFRFAENKLLKWGAVLGLLPFTLWQLIGCIIYTVKGLKMTTLAGPLKEVKLSISFNICNVIADVSIAVIMSYLLQDRRKRIASRQTRKTVEMLIYTTINSGAWTAIFALITLVLMAIIPDQFWLVGIGHMPLCSLYCNSLLGNLNARKVANQTDTLVHTLPMSNLGSSNGSGNANHSIVGELPYHMHSNMEINIERKVVVV